MISFCLPNFLILIVFWKIEVCSSLFIHLYSFNFLCLIVFIFDLFSSSFPLLNDIYLFILGMLAVSRAIGDAGMSPYVSSEPYIASAELNNDAQFLILACDGKIII